MTWDFGEINPFCEAASWTKCLSFVPKVLRELPSAGSGDVEIFRSTAIDGLAKCGDAVIATDPPYYDQITYSDLSDVFYVFLRPTLKDFFPGLLSTLLTPKAEELIANQFRFDGNKEESKAFFEKGLGDVFCEVGKIHRSEYPFTLFYAFRQSEVEQDDEMAQDVVMSSGWETMLQGLVDKKFQILGTMPMRTERPTGIKKNINALASSIVLVCRPRSCSAETVTRRDLVSRLKSELPDALKKLKQGNIAATDLAQAAIGPGMAVFSRYEGVIEADGSKMNVRTALGLINQILDEVMSEQDNDLDPDSRWAVTWFETHAFEEGLYGDAETLSKAKNTSPRGLQEAGIISCRAGKVKLLEMNELQNDWDPALDKRLTVWEVTHHLLRILETRGEDGVAAMLKKVGRLGESARDLAYRLYSVCERKKWAALALQYNSLVISWSEISRRVAVAELNEQPLQGNLL
jgi:putative DNA methylase